MNSNPVGLSACLLCGHWETDWTGESPAHFVKSLSDLTQDFVKHWGISLLYHMQPCFPNDHIYRVMLLLSNAGDTCVSTQRNATCTWFYRTEEVLCSIIFGGRNGHQDEAWCSQSLPRNPWAMFTVLIHACWILLERWNGLYVGEMWLSDQLSQCPEEVLERLEGPDWPRKRKSHMY
jgi:hypothetical protein